MNKLFIEVFTEEVPVIEHSNQKKAIIQFFNSTPELKGDLEVFSSRERLLIKLTNFNSSFIIPAKKLRGPSVNAPKKAIQGFLSKVNAETSELKEENGFFTFQTQEQNIDLKTLLHSHILEDLFKSIVRSFSKTMIWNETKKHWIRPIHKILTSLNDELINFEYAGIKAEIFSGLTEADYNISQELRLNKIKLEIEKIETNHSLKCVSRNSLLVENSYLTNSPNIQFDYFDTKYLKLPSKVLIQTLEQNQKYFLFKNQDGTLSNLFAVCIEGEYPNEIIQDILRGNKKVLHSRLEDAVFYFKIDTQTNLLTHLKKTKQVVFHKNAGTVFERVQRMLEISNKYNYYSEDLATAIKLCKADLQTEMTQSFTELQGYIGSFYAQIEGYSDEICQAVSLQYKMGIEEDPSGKNKLTLLLALTEKYEKITTLLNAGEIPTSSRDPFAIRRDALAIIKIIIEGKVDIKLDFEGALKDIIFDRLKFYLKSYDKQITNSVFTFESKSSQVSILEIYNKVILLSNNKLSFNEFYRIYNILNSKEAQSIQVLDIKNIKLDQAEQVLYDEFIHVTSLEDIIKKSYLIDQFFTHNLIIDETDLIKSQTRISLLQFILNKIQKFICV